ncbi:MAG: type I 3-dehydroquinate dehydratase [Candidatus Asgardarchaeia archaeon]
MSVGAKTIRELVNKANLALDLGGDLVETRLDFLKELNMKAFEREFSPLRKQLIITYRSMQEGGVVPINDFDRVDIILKLVSIIRPSFFDIELSTIKRIKAIELINYREESGLIISWHNFNFTPTVHKLFQIYKEANLLGDVIKIVPMANTYSDNSAIIKLYKLIPETDKKRVIAFCMGSRGIISRFYQLLLDTLLTYTSLPGEPVAEGQISIEEARTLYESIY